MNSILTIAFNDIRRMLTPSQMIATFVPYIVLILVVGFANSSGNNLTYRIDVVRNAEDAQSTQLVAALRSTAGKGFLICDLNVKPETLPADCQMRDATQTGVALATTRLERGVSVAALLLPADYATQLKGSAQINIELLTNGSQATSQLIRSQADGALAQLNGALITARTLRDRATTDQAGVYDRAYPAAEKLWSANPIQIETQQSIPVAVSTSNGFGQSTSGMGSMAVMSFVLGVSAVFLIERREGTLQRLLTLPVTRFQILIGKLLSYYIFGVLVFAVMIGIGLFFGVRWGDPFGVVVVVLTFTLTFTALGLAVSTFVRSSAQAAGITLLITMTLAPLGGAWWPLNIVPQWMQTIGRLSPIAWSQDAFTRMVYYGGTLIDILPSVLVLLGFASVFLMVGLARFRYE
jgi:ABC-2 type transport system permease protein